MSEKKQLTIEEAHTEFAKKANGRVWNLLMKDSRSAEEDQEMIAAAFTSGYHWRFVGTALHQQRAEWLLAHVYTVLGNPAAAITHAENCRRLTDANQTLMQDFDFAYAAEGLARAHALAGNKEEASRLKAEARQLGDRIENAEDKKIFDGDFDGGEWFGID